MYGYIYKTTNLINRKIYVGQKKSDKFLGNKYLGSGAILKLAIKKYKIENFNVEFLEECDNQESLNNREVYWINYYGSTNSEIGYNLTQGGTGGDTLKNISSDKRLARNLKLSNALKNKVWMYNDKKEQIKVDIDTVDKYLEMGYHLGYKYKKERTKESYLKQSKTQTKIHLDDVTVSSIIDCYKNGDSVSMISRKFNLDANYIRRLLKSKDVSMRNVKEATALYHKKYPVSQEARKKMSEQRKGKSKTNEWKRKIGESNKGKVVTSETRQKLREYFLDRVWVNKDDERHQILRNEVSDYLNKGFSLGFGKRQK